MKIMTMKMTITILMMKRILYEVTCDSCGQKLNVSEDVLLEGEIECPNCGENLEFDFSELFSNEEDDECDADCASCNGCSDTEE